ncbi:dihydrolipoamide acetyltransferase [Leptotrichia sp. OH3620_COT-345]|uniref:dihydrolipoamide acetyltransferase n=1 Tax=Leptotrichia sp. OH3620_COT-345 TaxID=2491048 RepID=UPI000F64683C|nr:dihydrolipoamide acetyltransferase [Leptotrichia sp. OH3620_COT-345]RRD40409.1 dihydrolipoamide acetyltransferase [Leptotrichia sp. OH3620_COT-345]
MENDKLRATPAAREAARRFGIDLFKIQGSGAKGRVHKEDVETFNYEKRIQISPLAAKIAEEYKIDLNNVTGSGHNGKIMRDDILKLIAKPKEKEELIRHEIPKTVEEKQVNESDIEMIPMSPMRKVISKRMSESYFTAPTFTLNYEVDMSEVKSLREKILGTILEKTGKKVTITDIISFAAVKTLMKYKYVNSSLSEDGSRIIFHNYVNLAIAVGLDDGLLVPVIKDADKMTLSELVIKSKEIVSKALEMKLSPAEQSGSTFTISNLGMYGVENFNPIINQPNSAILGVAATVDKPVAVNGEVVIRPIMTLSLTVDHRVIDGLAGAKFMQELKQLLENPISMLV